MEGIVAGKMHYGDVAGRLKAARVDVIYFAGFPNEYEVLRSDVKAAGLEAQIIASDAATGDMTGDIPNRGIATDGAGKGPDESRIFMARQTNSVTTCGELVLASFEAFEKSARNLATFGSMLKVDANGDSHAATFVPTIYGAAK